MVLVLSLRLRLGIGMVADGLHGNAASTSLRVGFVFLQGAIANGNETFWSAAGAGVGVLSLQALAYKVEPRRCQMCGEIIRAN